MKTTTTTPPPSPTRRLVAVGVIARRTHGRTLRLIATPAGVTGTLRPEAAR